MSLFAQMEKNAQFQAELQRYEDQADFLFRKQRMERIEQFADQFEFLANEYPCAVYYQGMIYNSVYAAFQAARTLDEEMRQKFVNAQSVQEVYQIAQHIDDPQDWTKQRLRIMEILLRDKFRRNADIRDSLRATNNYQLINTYPHATVSNLYWGIVDGKGQNQIGRLLEQIRTDINNYEDQDKWLLMTFPIEQEMRMIPKVELKVLKEGENLPKIEMKQRSAFLYFGSHQRNHVHLAHPSISRRHAAIFANNQSQVCLIDLGSKGGTFHNDQFVEPHLPVVLANEDRIKFAKSTRVYQVLIYYDDCKKWIKDKIEKLRQDLRQLERINKGKMTQEELKATLSGATEDTILIKNLPEKASHLELMELFRKEGKIKELKIPIDRQTGNTRNVAFVRYEIERDAKRIINDKNKIFEYKGQKLKLKLVDYAFVEKFQEELRWGIAEQQQQQLQQQVPKQIVEEKLQLESSSSSESDSDTSSDSSSDSSRSRHKKHRKHKHRKDRHHKKHHKR